ncbi:MAG: glucose 1-dehydrogenase [Alphaproteobacteria bacterium]|nr:glucose 1-dehydrogenase [Alphaproteobacteria bacterium]
MAGRLAGKAAFVTGAASGLGRATARLFAAEGAHVAIADVDVPNGRAAALDVGAGAIFLAHDVTSEADWVRNLAAAASAFGRLDILVNNAGIGPAGTIEKTSLEQWREVHRVNLDGVFLGCKHVLPHLRAAGGGAIINMSSVAGLMGTPSLFAYGSSKTAVRQLTKSVALHCAARRDGIRCNSIHPVFVATPMVDRMVENARIPEAARLALAAQIPLGRLGEADEVAALALYLAADESRFVTGAEFVIDGGITAR